MRFDSALNPERPVPALLGNGQLVTTVGRSGYHDAGGEIGDSLHATQEFVLSGRRLAGPRHELIPFGTLTRRLSVGGVEARAEESYQAIQTDVAEVRTRNLYEGLLESTRSTVLAHRNAFIAETRITNHSSEDLDVRWVVEYRFGPKSGRLPEGLKLSLRASGTSAHADWESQESLGVVTACTDAAEWRATETGFEAVLERTLGPGEVIVTRTTVSFSDRIAYQEPVSHSSVDVELHLHANWWRDFWSRSELTTGDDLVDRFRLISLYTIACQATPWSIPPTVSKAYWDGGAFHDEYYPFVALISGGWTEIARRVPYFRLATLPEAVKRARAEGALYPWSSTEDGMERDPHGHWYTERFHLGQIAACAWLYWLYERRIDALEELYPVMRGCARYFERNMIERDERGCLRTKGCTDFDESAGPVSGGPFTMAAAVFVLDHAGEAGRRLGRDRESAIRWERLAKELRSGFAVDLRNHRYTIPNCKPLHVAVLGYIAPFLLDDGSEFARNSLKFIQERCKSENGWRPGLADAFSGSAWMWTAGHLGMCNSVVGDGEGAWEAVRRGPLSAGQFLSPNEHLSATGQPVVPWFTTGCGAWLAALHWMFARVDDHGDHLLPAVPESLGSFSFRGLRLSRGVSASARAEGGRLAYLSFTAPHQMSFSFEVPARFVAGVWPAGVGRIVDLETSWRIQVELAAGENAFVDER